MPVLGSVKIQRNQLPIGVEVELFYLKGYYDFLLVYKRQSLREEFYFFLDKKETKREMSFYSNHFPNILHFFRTNFELIYSTAIKLKIKCDL